MRSNSFLATVGKIRQKQSVKRKQIKTFAMFPLKKAGENKRLLFCLPAVFAKMPKNDLQCPFSTATVGYSFSKDFCGGNYVLQTCGNIAAIQRQICRACKELCGMVKFVNRENTEVTVFVTNADVTSFGEWWIMVAFTDGIFAKNLSTFNNFVFTLPLHSLDEIG